MCGWILRTFKTRERTPMLTLWKSLVRSNIDYCCQLWNPSRVCDIQGIEQIQRTFVRKISGMQDLSYWEQLAAISLYSLERRRERYIIMFVWRILEGLTPNFNHPDRGGINVTFSNRWGRSRHAPVAIQRMRYASFGVIGPELFNMFWPGAEESYKILHE